MNVIAVIQADLDTTPLGTASRLADELAGTPILRRTVERVCLAEHVDEIYVLCPSTQYERCSALLKGTRAILRRYDVDPPSWAALVRASRKWSLDGWRGGIGGTTYFDEFVDGRLLDGLLQAQPAELVLAVPPAAPLLDPALIDRMIEHHRDTEDGSRLTFTLAPPGIAGIVLEPALVHDLAEKGIPIGWVFSYKPDDPRKDLMLQPCCCEIPAELRYAVGRLSVDTDRSAERVAALLHDQANADLVTIGRWLAQREETTIEALPREVEIELTTDDPYAHSLLRPRGRHVPRRGPIDPALVERIVNEITRYDDALVVLGGFGDPLRHPQFTRILQAIRSVRHNGRGLAGLAVRTSAVDLSDEHIDALVSHKVDVLNVLLDAWSPELYGALQSPSAPSSADLEAVRKRLDRLAEVCRERKSPMPIVVPEMTKVRDNVQELDEFHDGWLRRVGAVCITGHSHYAGQCEDKSVIKMAPSHRIGCRRIRSRCLVLADGRLAVCDQDVKGLHTVGRIGEHSLEELWQNATFDDVRTSHRQGRFNPTPLCAACDDWHRP